MNTSLLSNRGRRRPRTRGQALVEFALVLPLFILILVGILDFGFLLFSRVTLINATREGARGAVTQIDNPYGIPALVSTAVQANATGLNWSDVVVKTTCVALPANHTAPATCDFLAGATAPDPISGDSVLVRTTYHYHSLFAQFFGTTIDFGTQVQMVIE